MLNKKALPVVKPGEPLEKWLARAVPEIIEQRGLSEEDATSAATDAWNLVNKKEAEKQEPDQAGDENGAGDEGAPDDEKSPVDDDGWGEESADEDAETDDGWGGDEAGDEDETGDGGESETGQADDKDLDETKSDPEDDDWGGGWEDEDVTAESADAQESNESAAPAQDEWSLDEWEDGSQESADQAEQPLTGVSGWVIGEMLAFASNLLDALTAQGQIDEKEKANLTALLNTVMRYTTEKSVVMAATPFKTATLQSVIEANQYRALSMLINDLRHSGALTQEEHAKILSAAGDMLLALNQALNERLPASTLRRSPAFDAEQASWMGESGDNQAGGMAVTSTPDGSTVTEVTYVSVLPTDEEADAMKRDMLVAAIKGGPGSGNWGHAGRPGKRGGSAPRSGSNGGSSKRPKKRPKKRRRTSTGKKRRRQAKSLYQRTFEDGGFTFEPIDDSSPTSGYALSIYPDREFSIKVDDLTEDVIAEYIAKNEDLWEDPENKIGGWLDTETGIFYLDISKVIDDRDRAVELAREHGQEGIFDLNNFETIIVKPPEERRRTVGEPATTAAKADAHDAHDAHGDSGDWFKAWEVARDAWIKSVGLNGPLVDRGVRVVSSISGDERMAVKSIAPDRIGGYLCVWGNERERDLAGEWFSQNTEELDVVFKAIGALPAIYHHGQDNKVKSVVIGKIDKMKMDDVGVWVEAQIRDHENYKRFIQPLIEKSVLGWSSGTLPGARRVNKSTGEIKRWPIIEGSVTPTPAEWRMATHWPVRAIKSLYDEAGIDSDILESV